MRLAGETTVRTRHVGAIGEECRKLVAAEAAADPRIVLEDKGSSLAVHYRLVPAMEQTLKARIAEIVARIAAKNPDQDLEIMNGKAVIEIKSTHFNKGVAVREMMRNPPFLDRRPVFIGDDITDESVFALLPALGGVGFSVERFTPGTNGTFSSPHEVRGWLASLCGGK
jgi:trehalose 6-phosphate phosphatase